MASSAQDFWSGSGSAALSIGPTGWLQPTEAYWRHWLARPELALVEQSCRAETALHRSLLQEPMRVVPVRHIAAIADADVAQNYRHFIDLRDAVQQSGSLQGWYLGLFGAKPITVPPLFIDLVAQAIVQQLLGDSTDALAARAAELFFRPQRITFEQGRVLAADSHTLAELSQTQGLGEIGRLMAQAKMPVTPLGLAVLGPDNAQRYWAEAGQTEFRSTLLLDLTHEIKTDVGHGLQFTMNNARSGLKPLAALMQRWVQQLLGVEVNIEPVQRIDDPQWRWHIGLDAEASALLNDLYEGLEVDEQRRARLISLFRLSFTNPAEMRRDIQGKPVYLGLMATADGQLRLKAQNLLLNLPLATRS